MPPENFAHDRRLARAQQAIVDKNAAQPAADRLVQQSRRHARIHSAAQAQDDPFPGGLGLDFLHRLVNEMAHGPLPAAAADAVDEIGDDFAPARRVRHFRVKLQPVKFPGGVFNGGELRVVRGGHRFEAPWNPGQFVPVRIPDLQAVGQAGKQGGGAVLDQQRPLAVFAFPAGFDLAAQKAGEQLHPVANPQDGDAQLENGAVRQRGLPGIDAGRPAGKNQPLGGQAGQGGGRGVVAQDGGIDATLANPPGDHLRELRAKIQDDNLFHQRKIGRHDVPPPPPISERKINRTFSLLVSVLATWRAWVYGGLRVMTSLAKQLVRDWFGGLGRGTLLCRDIAVSLVTVKPVWRDVVYQMYFIGVKSQTVVVITGMFTGMVLCAQALYPVSPGENGQRHAGGGERGHGQRTGSGADRTDGRRAGRRRHRGGTGHHARDRAN